MEIKSEKVLMKNLQPGAVIMRIAKHSGKIYSLEYVKTVSLRDGTYSGYEVPFPNNTGIDIPLRRLNCIVLPNRKIAELHLFRSFSEMLETVGSHIIIGLSRELALMMNAAKGEQNEKNGIDG